MLGNSYSESAVCFKGQVAEKRTLGCVSLLCQVGLSVQGLRLATHPVVTLWQQLAGISVGPAGGAGSVVMSLHLSLDLYADAASLSHSLVTYQSIYSSESTLHLSR